MRPPHLPNLPSLAKALAQRAAHEGGFVAPWDRFHGPPEGMQLGMVGNRPLGLGAGWLERFGPNVRGGSYAEKAQQFDLQSPSLQRALALNKSKQALKNRKGLGTGFSGERQAGRKYYGGDKPRPRPAKGGSHIQPKGNPDKASESWYRAHDRAAQRGDHDRVAELLAVKDKSSWSAKARPRKGN